VTWLLDANVLSELRKQGRCDPGVRAWFDAALEDDLFTSVLVIGEIRRGIESIRRRDVPSALALDQWLARVGDSFRDRVLPVDLRVAERWGSLE
jgi:predicted nucleic acid-binding protein